MTWIPLGNASYIVASQTIRSGALTYPRWEIVGPGEHLALRNTTTGKVLILTGEILRGETVTIDANPGRQSVTGSIQGNLASRLEAGSEFWSLGVGDNAITVELGQTLDGSKITLIRRPQ